MRRRIQREQRSDVDIPHAIDTGEESRRVLQADLFIPFPPAFRDLTHDKTDDGHGRAEQSEEHQKFEAVDDTLRIEK